MKYLIPLLFFLPWLPLPVFASETPDFSKEIHSGIPFVILQTSKGEYIQWPKHILPMIRVYSISTKHERHAIYKFKFNHNGKYYEIQMPEKSYIKYKKQMGIK